MPVSEEIRTLKGAIDESQIAITSLASSCDPRTWADAADGGPVGLLGALRGTRR